MRPLYTFVASRFLCLDPRKSAANHFDLAIAAVIARLV